MKKEEPAKVWNNKTFDSKQRDDCNNATSLGIPGASPTGDSHSPLNVFMGRGLTGSSNTASNNNGGGTLAVPGAKH